MTMEPAAAGPRDVDEFAGGELFGAYVAAFPGASRDAGRMLRVAVQIGQLERYQALLEGALRGRKPVADEHWHGLCASVSYIRAGGPLAWQQRDLPRWLRDAPPPATSAARARVGLKVLAIAICATVLGLCLPSYETLDYWVGMAAFLVALIVAAM
jgi:hypothetical protein